MGEEKGCAHAGRAFFQSLMWITLRDNRGERSNSLKVLTYVERVVTVSSPPFLN